MPEIFKKKEEENGKGGRMQGIGIREERG